MNTLQTYQHTIESTRVATALHMTQDSDTSIVLKTLINHLPYILSGNGMTLTIHGTLSDNDNVQTLSSRTLLLNYSKNLLDYVLNILVYYI